MSIKADELLVSIYIPTHNRSIFLMRAVASVLCQTYKNIEVIVVADGCTDNTLELLSALVKMDSRVRYIENGASGGAGNARNLAIFAASGDYITGLDDDDYLDADHVANLVALYRQKKAPILGFSYWAHTNKGCRFVKRATGLVKANKLGCYNFFGNQIFTKTEYIQSLGGFDTNLSGWEDYDLWFRMVLRYGAGYMTAVRSSHVDMTHLLPRITASSSHLRGAKEFLIKHRAVLNSSSVAVQKSHIAYLEGRFDLVASASAIFSPTPYFAIKLILKSFFCKSGSV